LNVNSTGSTYSFDGNVTANGNTTITAGTLDASGSNYTFDAKGNWTNGGSFNARASTITFSRTTGAQYVDNRGQTFAMSSLPTPMRMGWSLQVRLVLLSSHF